MDLACEEHQPDSKVSLAIELTAVAIVDHYWGRRCQCSGQCPIANQAERCRASLGYAAGKTSQGVVRESQGVISIAQGKVGVVDQKIDGPIVIATNRQDLIRPCLG